MQASPDKAFSSDIESPDSINFLNNSESISSSGHESDQKPQEAENSEIKIDEKITIHQDTRSVANIKVKVDCLDVDEDEGPFYRPRFLES